MFTLDQKIQISAAIQKLLRDSNQPQLPEGEIEFSLVVLGKDDDWDSIRNFRDINQ